MNRRAFVTGLGAVLAAPHAAEAQQAARTVTIGYLGNSSPSLESTEVDAFREGLQQLGYAERKNLVIKYKWAEGRQERYGVLARELVALNPDVIFTAGTPGTIAARQATRSIPIVAAVMGDPVATGLVESLSKPGGNITGLSTLNLELEAKRLELFKQAIPNLSRLAVVLNTGNPFNAVAWKHTQRAAEMLSITVHPVEVHRPDDIARALSAIKATRVDGLVVMPDRVLLSYRASILQFMVANRLPGMFAARAWAQDGGLMAYEADTADMYRRSAGIVDKIVRGAKPADLPVEQPTKFVFVINLKTAKALALTIPPSVLGRADQLVE
jgi:ABC-type uncharacterized transport system substrate-binding protein